MIYMDYNCQDCKVLNDSHLEKFPAAYTGWGVGNFQEPFGSLSPRTPYIH